MRIRELVRLGLTLILAGLAQSCDWWGDDDAPAPPSCDDDGNACTVEALSSSGNCLHVDVAQCNVPHAATVILPSGSSCIPSTCPIADTDGDGLNDAWEQQGGIDLNCDGVISAANDVLLPDADPAVTDVYLEYDYMEQTGAGAHSHAPSAAAVQATLDAFARQGVVLHVDPVHEALPHYAVVSFEAVDPACAGNDAVNFHDLKATHSAGGRLRAYHYVVFAHYHTCGSPSQCANCPLTEGQPAVFGATGKAELPGNDVIVSDGAFHDAAILPALEAQAGLLMHELGHNLRLQHGGNVSTPAFKPNYVSVVNSNFTFTGIPFATTSGSIVPRSCASDGDCTEGICTSGGTCARIDYSTATLPALDESSLDESAGLQGSGTDITTYNCPDGSPAAGPVAGAIDWNCAPPATETGVTVDINADGMTGTLTGFDDWSAAAYEFQCTASGSANAPPPPPSGMPAPGPPSYAAEPSLDQLRARHRLFAPLSVRAGSAAGVLAPDSLAVFGSTRFDVAEVEPASLNLGGLRPVRLDYVDLDGDGRLDLLVGFPTGALASHRAHVITGWLRSSRAFSAEAR